MPVAKFSEISERTKEEAGSNVLEETADLSPENKGGPKKKKTLEDESVEAKKKSVETPLFGNTTAVRGGGERLRLGIFVGVGRRKTGNPAQNEKNLVSTGMDGINVDDSVN